MFAAAATTPTTTPGLTKHDNGRKTSDYSDGCNFSEDFVTLVRISISISLVAKKTPKILV